MDKFMKILITTGIYPPKIGGPAQYAKNVENVFIQQGNKVLVKTFNIENYIPTGIRHIFFFIKIIPAVLTSNMIIALDTYGVGFPTVFATKLLGRKSMIRTGGDFLWEQYVERTGKKVLLKNFYITEKNNFNLKEKIIFKVTRWTLQNASMIVFSTEWQRDIFVSAYGLLAVKTSIVENYYGEKESDNDVKNGVFVASTRKLKWKNITSLENVFDKVKNDHPYAELFTDNLFYSDFIDKIKNSYAVIQVSLGDISPNMILDAIRCNKPFICTKEVGIYDRIKDVGVFVDPLNESEIEREVLRLLDPVEYEVARQKVQSFSFVHSWKDISEELISVYKNL